MKQKKKYLLLNGANLNMLGIREPEIYGTVTLSTIEALVLERASELNIEVECFQSNYEGAIIEKIHGAHTDYDGVVFNPGAHTHYSYAIRDAISSIETPVVEVHLSDIDKREAFRAKSVVAPACVAQIKGHGAQGYVEALNGLVEGWSTRLGEGFEKKASGQVIVGDQL